MDKWMGQIVTIREIDFIGNINIEEDIFDRPPIGWVWAESDFEPIEQERKWEFSFWWIG